MNMLWSTSWSWNKAEFCLNRIQIILTFDWPEVQFWNQTRPIVIVDPCSHWSLKNLHSATSRDFLSMWCPRVRRSADIREMPTSLWWESFWPQG
jgi:hypothetical protein